MNIQSTDKLPGEITELVGRYRYNTSEDKLERNEYNNKYILEYDKEEMEGYIYKVSEAKVEMILFVVNNAQEIDPSKNKPFIEIIRKNNGELNSTNTKWNKANRSKIAGLNDYIIELSDEDDEDYTNANVTLKLLESDPRLQQYAGGIPEQSILNSIELYSKN